MVNDRTGGSSAYDLGEGKSIGAEQFNVGLTLKPVDGNPKDFYQQ
jgi:hypothetical protein